jgi:hypothetical protein
VKTGGGNEKGAEWERHCCKRLSLWVTKGERDDIFWRTAMSGGRATFQLRRDIVNRAQAGDMTAIAAEGVALCERYLFEYKHRKDLGCTGFLAAGTGLLAGFWRSTQKTAERVGKVPVLIAKQNFYPAMVLCAQQPRLFSFYQPAWAILPGLQAELFWFVPATEVRRPRLRRPREAVEEEAAQ